MLNFTYKILGYAGHSCRSASIGSIWAALRAGKKPKMMPMKAEKMKAIAVIVQSGVNGMFI